MIVRRGVGILKHIPASILRPALSIPQLFGEFELRSGDIAITRSWELHRLGGSHMGPNRLHWLILDVGVRSYAQKWTWPSWFVLSEDEASELEVNWGGFRDLYGTPMPK